MVHARFYQLLAGICLFFMGCHSEQAQVAMTAPAIEPAKAALNASLNAWKTGAVQPQTLIGSKPAIGTVDVQRIGKRLADYQIVGPLAARGTARPFAVRLVFEPQTEPVETRYVVIGQDPLWVFGHADYERILHWEHAMDGQPANPAPQNQPSANPESSHP